MRELLLKQSCLGFLPSIKVHEALIVIDGSTITLALPQPFPRSPGSRDSASGASALLSFEMHARTP